VINTSDILPSPEATDSTAGVTSSKYKMLGPLHLAYVFLGCAKETGIQSPRTSLPPASVSSVTSNKLQGGILAHTLYPLHFIKGANTPHSQISMENIWLQIKYKLFSFKRHNFSTK